MRIILSFVVNDIQIRDNFNLTDHNLFLHNKQKFICSKWDIFIISGENTILLGENNIFSGSVIF